MTVEEAKIGLKDDSKWVVWTKDHRWIGKIKQLNSDGYMVVEWYKDCVYSFKQDYALCHYCYMELVDETDLSISALAKL